MNSSILISIVTFTLILLIIFYIFNKTKDIQKYNIFIYFTIFIFWLSMSLFHDNFKKFNLEKQTWVWPIIISLFHFVQVVVRIPLGMLSAKKKSRKLIIQIASSIFALSAIAVVSANFSLWSLIIGIMGAGVFGATFGLDTQYYSENWNIKKVFKSTAIMYTIPVLASATSNLITNIVFQQVSKNNTVEYLRWIILTVVIIHLIWLIYFSYIKEHKETIGLDLGLTKEQNKNIKKIGKGHLFSIIAFFTAFTLSLAKGVKNEYADIKLWLLMATILSIYFTSTYFIKIFQINHIKLASLSIIAICSFIAMILKATHSLQHEVWTVLLIIIIFSGVTLQMVLFGSTLHLDHKHPFLVLGLFLTIRSLGSGLGVVLSGEASMSLGVLKNPAISEMIQLIILASIFTISLCLILFILIKKNTFKTYYGVIQKYEFY